MINLKILREKAEAERDRFRKALQHYECKETIINGQRVAVYWDSGVVARKALAGGDEG